MSSLKLELLERFIWNRRFIRGLGSIPTRGNIFSKFYNPYYRPKRSFGQGNVLTGVCDSVHRGGLQFFGGVPQNFLGGGSSKFSGGVPPNFRGGVFLQIFFWGEWFLQNFRGVSNFRNTVNVRPVRILLECILVYTILPDLTE